MRQVKGICIVAALLLLAGCGGKGRIDAKAVEAVATPVMDRHDAYVKTKKNPDGTDMSDAEQETYLRSTELMRRAIATAKGEKAKAEREDPAPKAPSSDPAPAK